MENNQREAHKYKELFTNPFATEDVENKNFFPKDIFDELYLFQKTKTEILLLTKNFNIFKRLALFIDIHSRGFLYIFTENKVKIKEIEKLSKIFIPEKY